MKKIIYLTVLMVVSLIACSSTIKKEDTKEKQNLTIIRFDKDIYNYLQSPSQEKESELKEKYPLLLPAFGRIAMDNSNPATFFTELSEYFAHPALTQIYKDALNTFADLSSYEEELTTANTLISEHFAGRKLPELAMHISGFRENVIILNNLISISTDKYLGSEYPAYKEFFQPYERQQMQPKFITRDYLRAWLISDIVKADTENQSLLSAMVAEGKILYALSVLLPANDKNDLIGYTPAQTAWCKENEKTIWQNIVKQNYLFSTDHMMVTRFVNDAAYTAPVSQSSPGRVGCWVGWQIVEKYANRKGVSLQEVINTDAQTILKESKYNP